MHASLLACSQPSRQLVQLTRQDEESESTAFKVRGTKKKKKKKRKMTKTHLFLVMSEFGDRLPPDWLKVTCVRRVVGKTVELLGFMKGRNSSLTGKGKNESGSSVHLAFYSNITNMK